MVNTSRLRPQHAATAYGNPDRVTRSVFTGDRIREDLVDLPKGVPAGRLRRDTVDQVVKERPGHAIGEPVVVAFDVGLGEANRHQASRAQLRVQIRPLLSA